LLLICREIFLVAPEIDWVLWADVDLVDYEPTLIERLMEYAQGSFLPAGTTEGGAALAEQLAPTDLGFVRVSL
jgi:hypothetical protein